MRQPRIELGAQRWHRWILPLNHWRKVQGMGIEPTTSAVLKPRHNQLDHPGRLGCFDRESNTGPQDLQSCALPTELSKLCKRDKFVITILFVSVNPCLRSNMYIRILGT